jgi:molybdopterin-guanine dinucleotide biosynthesis protein B
MRAIGLVGVAGVDTSAIAAELVGHLRAAGHRVSAVKHADDTFDIEPADGHARGLRDAGAFEVVVASRRRLAKLREFEVDVDLTLQHLLAELAEPEDRDLWVVFEGFRHASHQKVEFWEPGSTPPPLYAIDDPYVVALVTSRPEALPQPTLLPQFGPGQAAGIAAFLLRDPDRFEVRWP